MRLYVRTLDEEQVSRCPCLLSMAWHGFGFGADLYARTLDEEQVSWLLCALISSKHSEGSWGAFVLCRCWVSPVTHATRHDPEPLSPMPPGMTLNPCHPCHQA